jgi:hypothetical protein
VHYQLHAPAVLFPEKQPPVLILKETRLDPDSVWTGRIRKNSWLCRDSNSDPSFAQPAANRYVGCLLPLFPLVHCRYMLINYNPNMKCFENSNSGKRACIIVFAKAHHQYLSWATWIHFIPHILILYSHECLGLSEVVSSLQVLIIIHSDEAIRR